jgi:hypothetical protein
MLFNVVLEKEIRNIETNLKGMIFNRTSQSRACDNDVLMLG